MYLLSLVLGHSVDVAVIRISHFGGFPKVTSRWLTYEVIGMLEDKHCGAVGVCPWGDVGYGRGYHNHS